MSIFIFAFIDQVHCLLYRCPAHHLPHSDCDVELFVFDTSLLQDYCSPKVEATKMSINNLTHENLKAELTKMEQRLEEYERQHTEKVHGNGIAVFAML